MNSPLAALAVARGSPKMTAAAEQSVYVLMDDTCDDCENAIRNARHNSSVAPEQIASFTRPLHQTSSIHDITNATRDRYESFDSEDEGFGVTLSPNMSVEDRRKQRQRRQLKSALSKGSHDFTRRPSASGKTKEELAIAQLAIAQTRADSQDALMARAAQASACS